MSIISSSVIWAPGRGQLVLRTTSYHVPPNDLRQRAQKALCQKTWQRAISSRYHLCLPPARAAGPLRVTNITPRGNVRSRRTLLNPSGRLGPRLQAVFHLCAAPPYTNRRLSAPTDRGYFCSSQPLCHHNIWIRSLSSISSAGRHTTRWMNHRFISTVPPLSPH